MKRMLPPQSRCYAQEKCCVLIGTIAEEAPDRIIFASLDGGKTFMKMDVADRVRETERDVITLVGKPKVLPATLDLLPKNPNAVQYDGRIIQRREGQCPTVVDVVYPTLNQLPILGLARLEDDQDNMLLLLGGSENWEKEFDVLVYKGPQENLEPVSTVGRASFLTQKWSVQIDERKLEFRPREGWMQYNGNRLTMISPEKFTLEATEKGVRVRTL
jgi:hypothetical protein